MEEAPAGPIAAAVAAANNAVVAANDFFNNPLSAVQPNVFQNVIPGVKEAIVYLLNRKLEISLSSRRTLKQNIEIFLEDLKESNSLIAGGFVLAAIELIPHLNSMKEIDAQTNLSLLEKANAKDAYLGEIDQIVRRVNDVDVYMPIQSFALRFGRMFDQDMVGYFAHNDAVYKRYRSSIYCESFLRRNGIKAVHRYTYPTVRTGRRADVHDGFHFDVMTIRNKHSPLKVVNNFDLTFCQVWFDGVDCYATYPDHVNKKQGWVQKAYLPILFRGNHFIKDRIKKYRSRGYKILQNPELTPELAKAILEKSTEAVLDTPPELCDSVTAPVKRYDDPKFLRKWVIRMLLDDLATYTYDEHKPERYFTPLIEKYKFEMWYSRHDVPDIFGIKRSRHTWGGEEFNGINPDDGYDTEDFDEDLDLSKFKDFVTLLFNGHDFAEGINPRTTDDTQKTLVFYRFTNSVLEYLYKEVPNKAGYLTETIGETLTDVEQEVFDVAPKLKQASKKYLTALRDICLRKATEDLHFATEGDEVFDIHKHALDKAISAETLEGYLNQYISQPDHESVPCYQYIAGDPSSCQKKITFATIRYIVSPEFYKKYTKPAPIKTGLNQSIAGLNITLENTKSTDPVGFGDIYHYTMCPFCLQLENRDEGCAYMTHDNPKRRPEEDTPYCQANFQVDAIRNKYIEAGRQIFADRGLNDLPLHLEFCIECGRPCLNHEHFSLTDPPTLIPSHNPGVCDGGGRAELFARILAVRQVYRDGGFTIPSSERLAAALAADEAPRNADLMARGQVISDMPPTERIWGNTDVPTRKDYNDPAYRGAHEENNNAGSNTGSENSFNAAAYGFGANNDEEERKHGDDDEEQESKGDDAPPGPPTAGGKRKGAKGYRLTRKLGKQHYRKSRPTKRN
jgi:hypothetical protein